MRVIGIDPGITGAVALIDTDGALELVDMPVFGNAVDTTALADQLARWGHVDRIIIEDVSTRPGLSANSVLRTGVNWGLIVGVISALARPYEIVRPQRWTAWHACGADKDDHRAAATRLHPNHADLFRRKKDHGRADAVLIAEYGRARLAGRGAA